MIDLTIRATPRAILFDLDDTLTDRAGSIDRVAGRFQERFGRQLSTLAMPDLVAAIRQADGGGYRPRMELATTLAATLPWTVPVDPQAILAFWLQEFPAANVLRSGAISTITALAATGIRLGIVSNGSTAAQSQKIELLGLKPWFQSVIISEACGCRKPDPRIFAMALADLQTAPGDAWFVGDHPVNDIIGATAAGLSAIWIGTAGAWPSELARPFRIIRELPDVLEMHSNNGWDGNTESGRASTSE